MYVCMHMYSSNRTDVKTKLWLLAEGSVRLFIKATSRLKVTLLKIIYLKTEYVHQHCMWFPFLMLHHIRKLVKPTNICKVTTLSMNYINY